MKASDLLRLSWDNLRRRKGRTALSIIGVVLGVCALVVMISLGLAVSAQNEALLQSWGDLTQIQIYNYGSSSAPTLDDAMLASFNENAHVVCSTPFYQSSTLSSTIYAGKNDRYQMDGWNTYALYPEALEPMGFALESGTFLSEDLNVGKGKIPVLIGVNTNYQLEDSRKSWNSGRRTISAGDTDSLGNPKPPFVDMSTTKTILRISDGKENGKTKDFELVVVGVMVSDYSKAYFTDSGMVMRLSDMKMLEREAKKLAGGSGNSSDNKGYQEVYIKVDDVNNVSDVESWIKEFGYDTYSMTQVREEMQSSVAQSQLILGGLAAVSLLVAALNIANTMTMAIYERTKEIGVMKVLGCELGAIRSMFLVESGAIGFLGGLVGVAISYIISFVLNHLPLVLSALGMQGGGIDIGSLMGGMGSMAETGAKTSIIPPWLVLLALGFSTLVGILSGLLPSGRAMRISALEAIRHD